MGESPWGFESLRPHRSESSRSRGPRCGHRGHRGQPASRPRDHAPRRPWAWPSRGDNLGARANALARPTGDWCNGKHCGLQNRSSRFDSSVPRFRFALGPDPQSPPARALRGDRARDLRTPALERAGIMLAASCGRSVVVAPEPSKLVGRVQFPSPALSAGEWRSLVAHPAGGRKVAGSNPVSPIVRASFEPPPEEAAVWLVAVAASRRGRSGSARVAKGSAISAPSMRPV